MVQPQRISTAHHASVCFPTFAPDALFTLGGYPGDEDKARELFQKLDQTKTLEDFVNAADILKNHPEGTGNVRVSMLLPQSWPGNVQSTSSTNICAVELRNIF